MPKPNFLIIGAARAGTTSLYFYLKQHPDIYMSPIKEPHFFAYEGESASVGTWGPGQRPSYSTRWEDYWALFQGVSGENVIGEASASYFYHPKTPERIRARIPDVKMVAILRNPIDRALSHYLLNVRHGTEPIQSFAEALASENERIAKGWHFGFHYARLGLYAAQLERYFHYFSRDQLKVYFYADLKRNRLEFVRDIFNFLDVDPTFTPDTSKIYNPHSKPKSKSLQYFLAHPSLVKTMCKTFIPLQVQHSIRTKLWQWNLWYNEPLPKPQLDESIRERLVDYYRADVLRLQGLIGRDLSHWLKASKPGFPSI